ncbi:hypothetical protein NMY22_g10731 [Coprinellus aureogranulatus]|nr:hypothetical protein NMY22_g10731 [Coprinellus aureogranulatus]
MGRRAKYFTVDDRLAARRERAAQRALKPGAREARQAQNRRSYLKKKERELLNRDPPTIPKDVYKQATSLMSGVRQLKVFQQFCEGQLRLELRNLDVEWEDFDMLVGAPPYPNKITSNPHFKKEWLELRAALHGFMAHRYLFYCAELTNKCQQSSATQILELLDSNYNELVLEHSKIQLAEAALLEEDVAEQAIATLNKRWIARIMVYTVEDMVVLREGLKKFVESLAQRSSRIREGGRK